MTGFIPFSRDQAFLLPPEVKDWLPADDVAHFVVAAVDRVPLGAFAVRPIPGGKAQYHPRLLLALLIYCYANGIFSSRRIERATHRDIGVRYVAANLHPDHDTIAAFRRANRAAFEAAFLQVLLIARETGLLRLGMVAIDGTKLDANASKIRSVRYDRAKELREKLAADIAALTARAEAADAEAQPDPQALPAEIARREALKAKLDAACARLEEQARAEAAAAQPEYDAKKAAYEAKKGRRRGRPPKPSEDDPPPTRQSNLTDPDSALMRRSDAPSFAAAILGMEEGIGLPKTVLADTGFASSEAVAALEARSIEPLVAIGRTQPHRAYDFRPPPKPKALRRITEPWRIAMLEKLETPDAKDRYARRKQTVEPVFGIIKAALGFTRFHLRSLAKVTAEWTLIALAYNCRRLNRLRLAA
jgi:transposase